MDAIIKELIDRHTTETEKHIEEAFQKHFGYSIHDVDLREIEHVFIKDNPIQSFRYRGETFLYMKEQQGDIEICKDQIGVKLTFTTQYAEA